MSCMVDGEYRSGESKKGGFGFGGVTTSCEILQSREKEDAKVIISIFVYALSKAKVGKKTCRDVRARKRKMERDRDTLKKEKNENVAWWLRGREWGERVKGGGGKKRQAREMVKR